MTTVISIKSKDGIILASDSQGTLSKIKTTIKKVSKINKLPWLLWTSEDLRWSTTEGTRPDLVTQLLQKYFHRVMLLTPKSKIAAKSFFEIMHMIRSPLFVFHPLILFHVLLETLKRTNQQSK